jgi:hypothetical protein
MDHQRMNLNHIPPSVSHYLLPQRVLSDTWLFLRERGRHEIEAVVLWVGQVTDMQHAEVLAAIPPPQIAYRGEDGLAVEVPQDALTEFISALPDAIHVLARVHSHPGEAYHSALDDMNMLISHHGAISIVVPDFARGAATLTGCSVNRLWPPHGWQELSTAAVSSLFHVA